MDVAMSCGSNTGQEINSPNTNRVEAVDTPVTTEYITSDTSVPHGGSVPQVSGKLSPGFALAVTPGDCPDQHNFIQAGSITRAFDLKEYIISTVHNHITYYWCYYNLRQATSHIRHVHLNELKPFKCSCGEIFAHKQDARRHVNTKNWGKIYECTACHQRYAREDYRGKHERRCCMKTGKR
ncbi:hypothetical protein JB92DRAFT_3054019 [Gautieria morchelliformis]|nr:hypothetical protein JB92DRAFT_3054019 [Gautieria morchelliformis]